MKLNPLCASDGGCRTVPRRTVEPQPEGKGRKKSREMISFSGESALADFGSREEGNYVCTDCTCMLLDGALSIPLLNINRIPA